MTHRPNFLFLAIDDLRPQLNCYGQPQMHSPHLDRLSAEGVQFNRAYCQVPVCGASRASMFTGTRPTSTRFLDYQVWADRDHPSATCLPQYLKENGYHTVSRGKVFHHQEDSPACWSEPAWGPEDSFPGYRDPENIALQAAWQERGRTGPRGPAFESVEMPDSVYSDAQTADKVIQDLGRLKKTSPPFFVGAGFIRPHLPFNAPKRYWDLYNPKNIPLPADPNPPDNVPTQALHQFAELRRHYAGIPENGVLNEETTRTLIHGYYASVSFLDAQIGRVLQALEENGLYENTVVVLCVDHGWNLGEHGLWCKHCLFDTSTRVPIIIRAPGLSGPPSDALVENLDLYPTLCELAELETPSHAAGQSMVPLLKNSSAPGKHAVFSRYFKGERVKTDRHAYTEWIQDGQVTGRMLYDHQSDPDENVNIADLPENAELMEELHALLVANQE